ncbi:MAG: hypothetical protein ACYSU0_12165 [Planctomycetota bacterium]
MVVAKDGTFAASGRKRTSEQLLAFLKKEAGKTGRDEEGLPVLGVVISADPECAYRHVQEVMVQSMRAYIADVSWEMEGKRLAAHLPTGSDPECPVYIYEEPEPPKAEAEQLGTIDTSELEDEMPYEAIVDRPGPTDGEGDGAADRSEFESEVAAAGPVVVLREGQALPELRVKVYWANAKGQVIHSPEHGFPPGRQGTRAALPTEGAHVAVRIDDEPCADLDEFVRRLRKLVFGMDHPPVVIDPRRMVPFRRVFEVVEACGAAGAGKLRYQSPPVEGGGGSDWWWM